jgi:hypothetical protein
MTAAWLGAVRSVPVGGRGLVRRAKIEAAEWARSSAWSERPTHNRLVAGSKPAGPTTLLNSIRRLFLPGRLFRRLLDHLFDHHSGCPCGGTRHPRLPAAVKYRPVCMRAVRALDSSQHPGVREKSGVRLMKCGNVRLSRRIVLRMRLWMSRSDFHNYT